MAIVRQIFTSSGSWTPPTGVSSCDVVVVGGGGSGGRQTTPGGGGGAGAVVHQTNVSVTPGTPVTVTVGSGGASRTSNQAGATGSSSAFGSVTAAGGGGGGANGNGSSGASGGGGGSATSSTTRTGGSATAGYAGGSGTGSATASQQRGGGGGGAGAAGGTGVSGASGSGGAGGAGINLSSVVGTDVGVSGWFGGGGGGGKASGGSGGAGGQGGGGAGSLASANATAGTANTGGGGGGIGTGGNSGAGGSGIVIVLYNDTPPPLGGGAPNVVGSPSVIETESDASGNFSITLPPGGTRYVCNLTFGYSGTALQTIGAATGWTILYQGAPVSGEQGYFQMATLISTTSSPTTSFTMPGGSHNRVAGTIWAIDSEIYQYWHTYSSGQENGTTWDSRVGPTVAPTAGTIVFHFQDYQKDASALDTGTDRFPAALNNKTGAYYLNSSQYQRHRAGWVSQASAGTTTAQTWPATTNETDVWAWGLTTLAITKPPASSEPPVAHAGGNQTNKKAGTTVTLDASSSTDSDGTITGYSWAQTAGSPTVTLSGTGAARTFVAPPTLTGTTLTFQVTVTDNDSNTSTGTCTVAILPAPIRIMTASGVKPAFRNMKN